MAEIYLHSQKTRKLLMMPKQDVIVSRECTQFRVSLLDAHKCPVYRINGDFKDQLQKCCAYLAVDNRKHNARSIVTRDNEVCLGITDPHPLVDRYGSFFNEGSLG